jgi:small nuclear ribonucleoprotein
MSGRPLDVLEASLGDDVLVRLKGGELYEGRMTGYDQHMNLVLEGAVVLRAAGGLDPEEEGDLPEGDAEQTIIRGDNVVSISKA